MKKLILALTLILSTLAPTLATDIGKIVYIPTPGERQAQAWQDHLWAYAFAHPDLSAPQRAYINRAINALNFIDYNREFDRAALKWKFLHSKHEATNLFGKTEAYELLVNLNPSPHKVGFNLFAPPMEKEDCSCSDQSDWCDSPRICWVGESIQCNATNFGCGTLGLYSCNGACRVPCC